MSCSRIWYDISSDKIRGHLLTWLNLVKVGGSKFARQEKVVSGV